MFFNTSKLYCKYVIGIISDSIRKLKYKNIHNKELDDRLYESYLKLEEIINNEFFNS